MSKSIRDILLKNKKEVKINTISSLEVAQMLNKSHGAVLKDIDGSADKKTVGIIPVLEKSKFDLSDFYIESSYKSGNRTYKSYLITKQGCEVLGNKQQGAKGILFTAKYVQRFNQLEERNKQLKQDNKELHTIATSEEELKIRQYEADKIMYKFTNIKSLIESAKYNELETLIDKIITVNTLLKKKDRCKYHRQLSRTEYKQSVRTYIIKCLQHVISKTPDHILRTVAMQINTNLHKQLLSTTRRSTSMTIKNKNLLIEQLEQQEAAAKEITLEDCLCINRHGFSANYMFDKNFNRSKAYNNYINKFDYEAVGNKEYWEEQGVKFDKPIKVTLYYIAKDNHDVDNLCKATIDMIFNRIYEVDDNIIKAIKQRKIDTCTAYSKGKIYFHIRNI